MRDIAYDVLFKQTDPDKSSPTPSTDKSKPNTSPSPDRSTPDKASSVIVSANLFQEVLLAQFLAKDSKEQGATEGRAPALTESSTIPGIEVTHSALTPPSWTDAELELALQGLANYQSSQPVSGPSTSVNVSNGANSFVPPDTTRIIWSTLPVHNPPGINHVGNPVAMISNSSPNGVSPAAQSSLRYNVDSGLNMNVDTTSSADGEMDWITFMQLSGFTAPDTEVNAPGMVYDAGVGMDWESFQFS